MIDKSIKYASASANEIRCAFAVINEIEPTSYDCVKNKHGRKSGHLVPSPKLVVRIFETILDRFEDEFGDLETIVCRMVVFVLLVHGLAYHDHLETMIWCRVYFDHKIVQILFEFKQWNEWTHNNDGEFLMLAVHGQYSNTMINLLIERCQVDIFNTDYHPLIGFLSRPYDDSRCYGYDSDDDSDDEEEYRQEHVRTQSCVHDSLLRHHAHIDGTGLSNETIQAIICCCKDPYVSAWINVLRGRSEYQRDIGSVLHSALSECCSVFDLRVIVKQYLL
jgi:hypothetical protein